MNVNLDVSRIMVNRFNNTNKFFGIEETYILLKFYEVEC